MTRTAGSGSGPLVVVGVHDLAPDRIDRYVLDHPGGSVFHTREWAALVEETVGGRNRSLAVLRGDEVAGYLPLAEVQSPLRGRRLLSFPFSRFVPILAAGEEETRAMVARAAELAREAGASYLELRAGGSLTASALAGASHRADWRIIPAFDNYAIGLEGGIDAVRRRVHPRSTGHSIRLSTRRGVEVRWVDPRGSVGELRRLELLTRKRQGSAAYPRRFLPALISRFGEPAGRLWVGLAVREGKALAAEVAIVHGGTAHGILGLDEGERARQARSGHALVWAAIERATAEGLGRFDIGPAHRANEGLVTFKKNFGASIEPADAAILTLGGRPPADDDLASPGIRLLRRALRALPPRALALASEWLSREVM